jgi:hypothetical protein
LDTRLATAKLHFPLRSRAIDDLAARDDDFCTLCLDLEDAESSALKWENSATPRGERYRKEYLELAADLANEIETALDAAGIVSFHRP